MRQITLAVSVALMLSTCPAPSRCEVFVLKHGGRIEGTWLNPGDAPDTYQIEMASGGRVTLAADQVDEVIVKSDVLRRYEEFLPKVPNTLEGHWDMAERCRKAGLKRQREIHLRKVLEFDPDYADARRALGYSRVNGAWAKVDEWLKRQGYVRYKGAWKLPQEVELETRKEKRSVEDKEWRVRVRRWRSWVLQGRERAADGMEKLQSINDASAAVALAQLLDEDDEPLRLKLIYVDLLAKFPGLTATNALIRRLMKDGDIEVRERCAERLKKRGPHEAVTMLTRSLRDKDNSVVNRAVWGLGELGDPVAIPALIDALVTEHKFPVKQGGGQGNYNAGFTPTGGNSFNTGGGPRMVQVPVKNRHVLTALTKLTPQGINFGMDEKAWKDWYAHQQLGDGGNLRRRK